MQNAYFSGLCLRAARARNPGGPDAWKKFLNQNLHYPDDAINNGISGTVWVMFLVHKDSTITDIQVIAGPEKGGLREEAIRVITASGKWVPAIVDGRPVKFYKKVPVKGSSPTTGCRAKRPGNLLFWKWPDLDDRCESR